MNWQKTIEKRINRYFSLDLPFSHSQIVNIWFFIQRSSARIKEFLEEIEKDEDLNNILNYNCEPCLSTFLAGFREDIQQLYFLQDQLDALKQWIS